MAEPVREMVAWLVSTSRSVFLPLMTSITTSEGIHLESPVAGRGGSALLFAGVAVGVVGAGPAAPIRSFNSSAVISFTPQTPLKIEEGLSTACRPVASICLRADSVRPVALKRGDATRNQFQLSGASWASALRASAVLLWRSTLQSSLPIHRISRTSPAARSTSGTSGGMVQRRVFFTVYGLYKESLQGKRRGLVYGCRPTSGLAGDPRWETMRANTSRSLYGKILPRSPKSPQ